MLFLLYVGLGCARFMRVPTFEYRYVWLLAGTVRLSSMRSCVQEPDVPFISYIVFSNSAPTDTVDTVTYIGS